MKTYAICYDLRKPNKDYKSLIAAIKAYGTYWHYLDSTWIVKSNNTAAQIRDNLKPYIDSNDELLVITLTGESAWSGFDSNASTWLKNNILPTA